MSDLLRRHAQDDDDRVGSVAECWSPHDQLQVALEAWEPIANPHAVRLALGMSLSPKPMPAFIRTSWLGDVKLLVPTCAGHPVRAGRLKVMPVFTDSEALRSWLPSDRLLDHPCFGPPPDGLELASADRLGELRDAAGAVMVFLNPAGPGGYQVDPEDGRLDWVEDGGCESPLTTIQDGELSDPQGPSTATSGPRPAANERPDVAPPPAAAGLVDPGARFALRGRIQSALELATHLAAAGQEPEAVDILAGADRLAEVMGDYLHRAEMMMVAARILEATGRRYAAGRLAHYAALASSLCARGRLEMEAIRLRASLQ